MKFRPYISLALPALISVASIAVSGQDLGSANKLFGGKPAPAAKSTVKAKKAVARPTVARKNSKAPAAKHDARARTTPPAKGSDASATVKKRGTTNEITTPTGTKVRKPADLNPTASIARAPKLSPADEARYEALVADGNSALEARHIDKAESLYKAARSLKPRDARSVYGLGNVYREQHRWEEAENAYRAALQLDPSDISAQVALSYVLTQQLPVTDLSERYAEAEMLARKATEISPRTAVAFDQLGVAMEARGEIGSDTEAAYRRAIQLDPTIAPAYAHLGRLLRRRGLMDPSKQAYRQAIEHATDVRSMVAVAAVMQSEQRYADSVQLLRDALKADPHDLWASLMLGHALTVAQEYKEAESLLQAAAAGPSGYVASSLLASLYMRQGALELAEKALLQALRTAPAYEDRQLAQAFLSLGQGYTKAGKSTQAQRAYAQAAKLDPDSGVYSGRFKS